MRRHGRKAAGLADQILNAGANAVTGLLPAAFLSLTEAAHPLFALTCGFFVVGVVRALVGDTLLVHGSLFDDDADARRRRVTDAAGTAAALGVAAAAVGVGAWALGPDWLRDVVWVAPFLPFLLVHDAGRYAFLSARRPAQALFADGVFVGTQAVALTAFLLAGRHDAPVFLVSWGLGAVAGSLTFMLRTRTNPLRGRPAAWLRETRHLSGWFTGTALLGQAQVTLVSTLVLQLLSKQAFTTLRLAQYGLLMPAQNLQLAMASLLVPRFSRMANAGDRAGLDRLVRRAFAISATTAVVPVALTPLAGPLVRWLHPEWVGAVPLALPVAIQAGIYLLQISFTAAMRGMQQARPLFVQYGLFTASSLTGLVVGALTGGLLGAAWGLTAAAAVGFGVMLLLYRRALAGVGRVDARTPAGTADPTPVR